ncbi:urease accessory protein UreD [Cohnella faecalis]|uniref:Urease accessory protein UreD n=1 Tax=Cohnella faecalis TaxID=2315694 RepID=A0A398CTD8_9BACL|nr:urease accessory protein UreD [Cohnella faecalis]RIE03097.1 urease accessory protein UreD [Cohnella faecalis]
MCPLSDTAKAEAPDRLSELKAVAGTIDGRTQLVSRYHSSPLKIAKTFSVGTVADPQLAVMQMDGSPGLLEGDRYVFDWHLLDEAQVYATNQAYTRVHPCGQGNTRLTQRFRLEKNAVLEWIPEPIMLFGRAALAAETEVELAEGALCVWSDIFCPGRMSRGEAFEFRSFDAKLSVRHEGKLIHYQRQKWQPGVLPIDSPGCFGGFTHLGSFGVFSDRVGAELVQKIRGALEAAEAALPGSRIMWGAARTAKHGIVVQAAGHAAWPLQRLVLAAWDSVRSELLGRPPMRLLKEAWMGS